MSTDAGPTTSAEPRARERLVPWILAAAVGLGWFGVQPPAARLPAAGHHGPAALGTQPVIEAMAAQPRPAGSEHNATVRRLLVEVLHGHGWDVERQVGERRGVPLENLVARWPPSAEPPRDALLLVAHHDSREGAPGAGDDAAGVAALLEVARLLPRVPDPRVDVVLLITDGEELGLLGARLFAEEHPWLDGLRAVLNVEGRGCAGPSTLFETGPESGALVALLAASSEHAFGDAVGPAVYARMPNDTDFSVFRDGGLPGLNFAFFAGGSVYHREQDTPGNLDMASVQHHAEVLWAVTERVVRQGWPEPWGGERRAITVPLVGMLAVPPALVDVVAWVALALTLLALLRAATGRRARSLAVLAGLPLRLLAMAVSAGVVAGLVFASRELGGLLALAIDDGGAALLGQTPTPGSASNRVPTELTSVAAFALAAACGWPLTRAQAWCGLRARERALAALLLWAALIAWAQASLPGAAHLALLGWFAALGGLLLGRGGGGTDDDTPGEGRAWLGVLLVGAGLLALLPVQHLLIHVGSVDPLQVLVLSAVLGALTGSLVDPVSGPRVGLPALGVGLIALGHAGLELARAAAL